MSFKPGERACIDPKQHKELLDDIQGNILKSHAREHVWLLLLRFNTEDVPRARRWVRAFGGGGWVSTASAQERQARKWRAQNKNMLPMSWNGQKGDELFANLFLTYAGYQYLGIPNKHIPDSPSFRKGMRKAGLNSIQHNAQYESQVFASKIHAMVLLAAADKAMIARDHKYVEESLSGIAEVTTQKGQAFMAGPTQGQNHAHYVGHMNELEGISQPIFFKEDFDPIRGHTKHYDPSASPDLVLVKEPSGPVDEMKGYGSYLVYQKLEQNVREMVRRREGGGKPREAIEGNQDNRTPMDMAVGRFSSGKPLIREKSQAKSDIEVDGSNGKDDSTGQDSRSNDLKNFKELNDFNYDNDSACPLNAHVRKVNPRDKESDLHRIARRGVTYDDKERSKPASTLGEEGEEIPEDGVGILFMCFQRSIEKQFEHLMELAGKSIGEAGPDALIGHLALNSEPTASSGVDDFKGLIKLVEGGYFFAPSLSFFKNLPD